MAKDYNPLLSFPTSKNRLMVIDWASVGYHQWHSMFSKARVNSGYYVLDTSEKELEMWRSSMTRKVMSFIRLFNPLDVIIALEGDGEIWRKKHYREYYQKNALIFYDKNGFYLRFDNFLYQIRKSTDGNMTVEKLDPTQPLKDVKPILYDKLSPAAQQAINSCLPSYKGNRASQPWKAITPKSVWTKYRDEFAHKLSEVIRANTIMDSEAEGDDIIYTAITHNVDKYESIVLVTGDSDCNQLLIQNNLIIFNHQSDNLTTCINPRRYLEIKILSGDKSDNINGIALPGKKVQLGEAGATTLYESLDGNCVPAAETGGWINQYHRNRQLIDMSFIPNELKTRLLGMLDVPRKEISAYEKIYELAVNQKVIEDITSLKQLGYYTLHDYVDVQNNPNLFKESVIQIGKNYSKNNTTTATEEEPEWGFGGMYSK